MKHESSDIDNKTKLVKYIGLYSSVKQSVYNGLLTVKRLSGKVDHC